MIINETNYKIKLQNGEVMLLRDFYYRNYASFCSFASKYLSDEYEVEDVVQECFISFWELDNVFSNIESVKSFFYTSIRNSCLDIIKHERVKSKFVELQKRIVDSKEYFLDNVLKQEVYHYVHEQIGKLPAMEKKVVLMTLNDKSNKEIAEKLGIKINTVKTHKQRAYKFLRQNVKRFLFFIFQR